MKPSWDDIICKMKSMQRLYPQDVGNDCSGHMHDQWKIPTETSSYRISSDALWQPEKECCTICSNDNIEWSS